MIRLTREVSPGGRAEMPMTMIQRLIKQFAGGSGGQRGKRGGHRRRGGSSGSSGSGGIGARIGAKVERYVRGRR